MISFYSADLIHFGGKSTTISVDLSSYHYRNHQPHNHPITSCRIKQRTFVDIIWTKRWVMWMFMYVCACGLLKVRRLSTTFTRGLKMESLVKSQGIMHYWRFPAEGKNILFRSCLNHKFYLPIAIASTNFTSIKAKNLRTKVEKE